MTDNSGCYELKDLPPPSYRVTAGLAGFDNITHDDVAMAPSISTRHDFTMRASSICECTRFIGTVGEHLARADAVLHVRLSASEAAASTPQGTTATWRLCLPH